MLYSGTQLADDDLGTQVHAY